jgi:hypothetical protein
VVGFGVATALPAAHGFHEGVAVAVVVHAGKGVGEVGRAEIDGGLGTDVGAVGKRLDGGQRVGVRALAEHHALQLVGEHHPPVAGFVLVVDEAAPFRVGRRRIIGHRHDVGGLVVFVPHAEEETVGSAGVDPVPALGPVELAAGAIRVLVSGVAGSFLRWAHEKPGQMCG